MQQHSAYLENHTPAKAGFRRSTREQTRSTSSDGEVRHLHYRAMSHTEQAPHRKLPGNMALSGRQPVDDAHMAGQDSRTEPWRRYWDKQLEHYDQAMGFFDRRLKDMRRTSR